MAEFTITAGSNEASVPMLESNVSVKATTNEKLGPVGRSEGMAAIAIATIEIIDSDD